MFDFSLGKIFILALIALLVLGPDKLPGAARTAARLIRRLRAGWESAKSQVERELELGDLRRSAEQATREARTAKARADNALRQLQQEREGDDSAPQLTETQTSHPSQQHGDT